MLLIALAAVGCKSGSSWTAKPSWWTFGGSGEDPAKLASAPPASTDVAKPSATSKPYPTTSTPEGYVLESAQRAGQTQVASTATAPTTPASDPAAITYGSKPVTPPAAMVPSTMPQVAATEPAAGSLSSVAPQVGPYAAPPGAAPVERALPTSTPGSSFGSTDAMAATSPSPFGGAVATPPATDANAVRVADARGSDAWGSAAAAPPGAAAASAESRYGSGTGSRFGGGVVPAAPPPAAAAFPAVATPPSAPTALPTAPAALPAALDPLSAPAATPSSLAPPTPTRRPDPGYRPGGTSSYRPSRTILAGDGEAQPAAVQPASFELPQAAGMP